MFVCLFVCLSNTQEGFIFVCLFVCLFVFWQFDNPDKTQLISFTCHFAYQM